MIQTNISLEYLHYCNMGRTVQFGFNVYDSILFALHELAWGVLLKSVQSISQSIFGSYPVIILLLDIKANKYAIVSLAVL